MYRACDWAQSRAHKTHHYSAEHRQLGESTLTREGDGGSLRTRVHRIGVGAREVDLPNSHKKSLPCR